MGSNCSFGPCYNNATINFLTMKVLSLFLLVLQRPLKHQNLILHKFYLVELSCKLYNPFFRVVFHNPDNIIWCNFLVRTLQHCHCMGKRPGKMRNDAFYESPISLCFFWNMCCHDSMPVRIRSAAVSFSASFFISTLTPNQRTVQKNCVSRPLTSAYNARLLQHLRLLLNFVLYLL